ncbi:hypothetical protein TorRG33x02_081860 [Trema orientale]|uniref:Uncharacterized protein n=1 Tax=Trema orientale TaxID=63057 RepID=A0A2P5FDT0_TREOI|nr:hypothetical protein TorRG33x02_081860 [Trema orientale]
MREGKKNDDDGIVVLKKEKEWVEEEFEILKKQRNDMGCGLQETRRSLRLFLTFQNAFVYRENHRSQGVIRWSLLDHVEAPPCSVARTEATQVLRELEEAKKAFTPTLSASVQLFLNESSNFFLIIKRADKISVAGHFLEPPPFGWTPKDDVGARTHDLTLPK